VPVAKKARRIVPDRRVENLIAHAITEGRVRIARGVALIFMGVAAGDPDLFARKRRDAAAKAKLDELKDARKAAALPRAPLLAEPGAVQLPRYVYSWLVRPEAHEAAFTIADPGVLSALLLAFANGDPSLIVGARFEGEGDSLTLVVPGAGVAGTLRFHGRIAGSPIEDGSGFVRGRPALKVLATNKWFEVEQRSGSFASGSANGHGSLMATTEAAITSAS
jgi:hypothetical protein